MWLSNWDNLTTQFSVSFPQCIPLNLFCPPLVMFSHLSRNPKTKYIMLQKNENSVILPFHSVYSDYLIRIFNLTLIILLKLTELVWISRKKETSSSCHWKDATAVFRISRSYMILKDISCSVKPQTTVLKLYCKEKYLPWPTTKNSCSMFNISDIHWNSLIPQFWVWYMWKKTQNLQTNSHK